MCSYKITIIIIIIIIIIITKFSVDTTDILIDMPVNPSALQLTFTHYINNNALIAITLLISFISDLYRGNISDCELIQMSDC